MTHGATVSPKVIVALDEGTTSARAIVFDHEARIRGIAQLEVPQIYPKPGWVEQNPEIIWSSQLKALKMAIERSKISIENVEAIGITNQRETTIIWDRRTGKPVYNAIVWQCRRTDQIVDNLRIEYGKMIKKRTGLIPDSYFSAPKIMWLLSNVPGLRERAEKGEILFGTVDTYLIWKLSNGKIHIIDYSNASRTMLFNIHKLEWDREILEVLKIPENILPEPRPSSQVYGYTDTNIVGAEVPIASDVGDQQAALFGQACFSEGMVKCTYGTGNFILMNTGSVPKESRHLLTTIAWSFEERKATYALEGSIFITGAAIKWLRDSLGIIEVSEEIEPLAKSLKWNEGVYFVPAFVGLGAPYWDQYARGLLIGITHRTRRAHIARAILESIAYLTRDVIEVMEHDSSIEVREVRVDGGASKNNFLMQFQADILGKRVVRPIIYETTALGAALLAGLSTSYWRGLEEIEKLWKAEKVFEPRMSSEIRESLYRGWKEAVKRSFEWTKVLREVGLQI